MTSTTDLRVRLESYFAPASYTKLVRRNLGRGTVDDVEDAIQKVMLSIYKRYGDGREPLPDNLDAFVQRSIQNALLDRIRGEAKIAATGFGADGEAWDELVETKAASTFGARAVSPEEATSWAQTYAAVFDRLPPKWVDVAALVMVGTSPPEIGEQFGQDGYGLRAYTRKLIARILTDLAAAGDGNASVLLESLALG